MKKVSILVLLCVMALGLAGCGGGGSKSGTANLTFDGREHTIKKVEFSVEVSPDMDGNSTQKVEPGKINATRFSLRTEKWITLWDGKAFVIAWWNDTDDPMAILNGCIGQTLTNNHYNAQDIYSNFLLEGKSLEPRDEGTNWLKIESIVDGTVTGTFGGTFIHKDGKTYKRIADVATIANGTFSAPLRLNYEVK